MDFFKKIYQRISEFLGLIGSIFVGIISILGFFFFVKKKLENDEEEAFENIKDLEDANEKIDIEISKNSGKIEYIEKSQEELLTALDEDVVDDSKNLEDFFDKRGF